MPAVPVKCPGPVTSACGQWLWSPVSNICNFDFCHENDEYKCKIMKISVD